MSGYDNFATTTAAPYYVACSDPSHEDGLISDRLRDILEGTFQVVFCSIISIIGSVTNVINIIVFCKQGFNDTINISLLGLAISDLGALLAYIVVGILRLPVFEGSKIFLGTCGIYYLVGSWPHACFSITSSWITVFITFERCLYIAQPLRVKTIITKKRERFVIVAIFSAVFAVMLPPLFYALRIGPRYVKQYGRTLIVTFQIDNGMDIENAVFKFYIFCQVSNFSIVVICTVVLIRSLTLKSKWRSETANVSRDAMSGRDKSVAKLVVSISCIFIFSYLPSVVSAIITVQFSPYFAMNSRYENMYVASWAIINFFETINSSFNIIIYFKMSSKYRAVLTSMFCRSYKQTTR